MFNQINFKSVIRPKLRSILIISMHWGVHFLPLALMRCQSMLRFVMLVFLFEKRSSKEQLVGYTMSWSFTIGTGWIRISQVKSFKLIEWTLSKRPHKVCCSFLKLTYRNNQICFCGPMTFYQQSKNDDIKKIIFSLNKHQKWQKNVCFKEIALLQPNDQKKMPLPKIPQWRNPRCRDKCQRP